MASYLDREKIPVAVTESSKFDLSHVHITTADFMQLAPIMTKEMVPGERLDVQVNTFSRMDTLPVPTYGRCSIKNRGFFVPYRTIFRGWTDFITDAPHANSMNDIEFVGNILTVPTVTNRVLCQAFVDASVVYDVMGSNTSTRPVDVLASSTGADIIYVDASNNSKYFQLNALGRHLLKVVESLGYKINWNYADNTVYSALPLLAYAKVYCDWYFPSAYTNTDIYNYLLLLCNSDTGQPQALNKVDVARILQFSYVCYDSDYFVSAWDNPVAPNANNFSTFSLPDITLGSTNDTGNSTHYGNASGDWYSSATGGTNMITGLGISNGPAEYGTPVSVMNVVSGSTDYPRLGMTVTDYQHKALTALTDYFKRHQLAGSRALDRYLARFGKALSSEKMNRSVYLGSQIIPVQIGDVMSNSMVGQSGFDGLGEYAGKGIAYGQDGNFSYNTDEYGIFIMVSSIVPATGYYQGIDRNVKHVAKSDFFTPEFDGLGVQAITADELYVSKFGDASLASTDIHNHVFGFTPRYAEYKMKNDKVTGNFRVNHLNGNSLGSASWHLMREFDDSDFDASVANVNHGVNFVYSRGDMGQYNRIFAYQTDTLSDWLAGSDPFVLIHEFNVGSYAPMKPLYDTYEFDDSDKGRKVNLDVNGVKMN